MNECEHHYHFSPPWYGAEDSPYNIYRCELCGHDDWRPKDPDLYRESRAEELHDQWRYSALYQWRNPDEGSWIGWPSFRALSYRAQRKFKRRLMTATYEDGRAIINEVLKGRKAVAGQLEGDSQ